MTARPAAQGHTPTVSITVDTYHDICEQRDALVAALREMKDSAIDYKHQKDSFSSDKHARYVRAIALADDALAAVEGQT
jgi:hypothetical protein